jgi:hypothetical protein
MGDMSLCRTPYSIRDTPLHRATTRQRWRVSSHTYDTLDLTTFDGFSLSGILLVGSRSTRRAFRSRSTPHTVLVTFDVVLVTGLVSRIVRWWQTVKHLRAFGGTFGTIKHTRFNFR